MSFLSYKSKINDYFSTKVYIVIEKGGTPKLEKIVNKEIHAIEYLKNLLNQNYFNYGPEDIQENGSDEYDEDIQNALNFVIDYEILTIFGVDINKIIYMNIDGNSNIRDHHNIVTNDLEKWKKWNNTKDNPECYYYYDINDR